MGFLSIISNTVNKVALAILPNPTNIVKNIQAFPTNISNTFQTIKAAVTGQGVQANTPYPTVNKILSTAASNPFTTAAVGTVAVIPKVAATSIISGVKALPPSVKVALAVSTPVFIGAAVSNPKIVGNVLTAPSSLSSFGSNVGTFAASPSVDTGLQVFKDNPIISTAVIGAAGLIVGKGATGILNTIALRENTAATNKVLENMETLTPNVPINSVLPTQNGSMPATIPASKGVTTVPLTPETQVLGKPISTTSIKRYKGKKIQAKPQSQSVRVNIFNQSRLQSVKYLNMRRY
jgi:hypothetical protein